MLFQGLSRVMLTSQQLHLGKYGKNHRLKSAPATGGDTPLKTNMSPFKKDYVNRNYIFQPLIFRGHVRFQGSMSVPIGYPVSHQRHQKAVRARQLAGRSPVCPLPESQDTGRPPSKSSIHHQANHYVTPKSQRKHVEPSQLITNHLHLICITSVTPTST